MNYVGTVRRTLGESSYEARTDTSDPHPRSLWSTFSRAGNVDSWLEMARSFFESILLDIRIVRNRHLATVSGSGIFRQWMLEKVSDESPGWFLVSCLRHFDVFPICRLDDTIESTLRPGRPRRCDGDGAGAIARNAKPWVLFSRSY